MIQIINGKKIEILASFDDGGELDMQLADLLIKYKIPAVFYIPIKTRELSDHQIMQLSGTLPNCELCEVTKDLFEMGAHTMTHPKEFQLLPHSEIVKEVAGSKAALELLSRRPVTKFCYPRGRFNNEIKDIVRLTGFKEARTVKGLNTSFQKDKFQINPTIHVHPEHIMYGESSWIETGHELFDKVIKEGGRFEIWGHSAEIEKYNQWEFLEDFLWYMNEEMIKIKYPRKI